MSSANSCTIDSVFYEENSSQKSSVQNLPIPETVTLDLLIQSKTLGDNVSSRDNRFLINLFFAVDEIISDVDDRKSSQSN